MRKVVLAMEPVIEIANVLPTDQVQDEAGLALPGGRYCMKISLLNLTEAQYQRVVTVMQLEVGRENLYWRGRTAAFAVVPSSVGPSLFQRFKERTRDGLNYGGLENQVRIVLV